MPKRVAMAETVADEIAWAVAAVNLNPGERMGVSRVPIRVALKILHAQGIVVGEPNRGYLVAGSTPTPSARCSRCGCNKRQFCLRDAIMARRAASLEG